MHAESGEFTGEAFAKAPIVTSSAPVSPSAALISTDIRESGLWLWQGELPPTPPLPQPKSRERQILRRIMPVAGWAGWVAVPAGLAVTFLAVSMIPRPDRPVSADGSAVALSSGPSPAVTPPIVPVPPPERTEAKLDQVRVPGPETPVMKGRAQHKLLRSARKTHASHVRKWPLFPTAGVLTPPPPTWHGGGY
jgi:hypothetical protein